jgi:hypothetical protein
MEPKLTKLGKSSGCPVLWGEYECPEQTFDWAVEGLDGYVTACVKHAPIVAQDALDEFLERRTA